RVLVPQLDEQIVRLGQLIAKMPGALCQALADAVAQLLGGRLGKGHHEECRRQQRPAKAQLCAAMAEDQTHVEGGDGEGLAGAGTGFDQPAAPQGQGQRQVLRFTHAGTSSACQAAATSGPYSFSHSSRAPSAATRDW